MAQVRDLPTLETLAERAIWARRRKEYTLDRAGELVGTSKHQINKIEKGLVKQPRNIKKLAEIYEVPLFWLQIDPKDYGAYPDDWAEFEKERGKLTPDKQERLWGFLEALKQE